MPDQLSPQFEHRALEADIKRLALEIKTHSETPEMKGAAPQELIKKSIQSFIPTPSTPIRNDEDDAKSPLPAYARGAPDEEKLKIENLLDKAFHEGIEKANAEAKKAGPFVLDTFHDALTGRLYLELKKRGIVQ